VLILALVLAIEAKDRSITSRSTSTITRREIAGGD
jgi:hypothetical protein